MLVCWVVGEIECLNISNDVGRVKVCWGCFFHDFEHTFHVSAPALVPFEGVTILRR
jgi:hypothetical protein